MELYFVSVSFLAQVGVISLALTISSLFRDQVRGEPSRIRRASSGILFGMTAGLLMNMPGELAAGFRFDLRTVPIAVAGLVSGPLGSAVAATVASAARLEIGGAGAPVGLMGIWIGFAVGSLGFLMLRKGFNRAQHLLLFSGMNAAVALLILALLPREVRQTVTQNHQHLVLVALNFIATMIATFYVRLDQQRRENAQLNALHKQVVAALPDALNVKDLEGRFIIANEATAKLMGAASSDELIGRTDFHYYHPEDASRFCEQERVFVNSPEPVVLEQTFRRTEEPVWLSTVKAPYFNEAGELVGIVSHTTDVTAQRALQSELTAMQRLLHTAMNEMADGLAMFDQEGRLAMWNRRYIALFPYVDEESCRGRTLAEILTAGVLRGQIAIPADLSPMAWVEEEFQRSASAEASELSLSDGRWVAKTTSVLPDGGWVTLYSDITEKKAAVAQLERLASLDGLTGVGNRRFFDEQLEAAFGKSNDEQRRLSLLMIDVDHFKAYNDTYGHPAGDQVLRNVAAALQSASRSESDTIARYGGEEFAVILPDASPDIARATAVRFVEAVRRLEIQHLSSPAGKVTISVGVATSGRDIIMDEGRLLESADAALYQAKCAGRDTFRMAKLAAIGEALPA
jgi:diguanylate cyclase (GGDEF)-like protein/PAS domain S-box-containing protein